MFELPELDGLSATELDALLAAVRDEGAALLSALNDPATAEGVDLDRVAVLAAHIPTLEAAKTALSEAAEARATLAAELTAKFAVADIEVPAEVPAEPVVAAVETPAPVVAAAGNAVQHPKPAAVVAAAPKVDAPVDTRTVAIVAAAGVPGMRGGEVRNGLLDFVKPAAAKWGSYANMTQGLVSDELFSLRAPERDPRLVANGQNDQAVMKYAADEHRLRNSETGATGVVAAGGWCAPAEQRFDICTLAEVDGILDVPTISMPRGSISYFRQLDYSTVNTALNASGLFSFTNAQLVASPVVKPCFEIPCATPVTGTLDARGLCLRAGILQQKAFPELIAAWMDLALIAYAHYLNAFNIAEIVAGSGAAIVNPTTYGVISQILEAVALQATVYRAQNGMAANATLEAVFPWWVPALATIDHSRRQFNADVRYTAADLNSDLAALNVRAQWVKDFQATAFVAADPVTLWPTTVNFLLFAPGAWVRGTEDIISVSTLYDSTLLQTNRVQLLFVEAGTKMLPWCGPSKLVTVSLCASGETGGPVAPVGANTCGR